MTLAKARSIAQETKAGRSKFGAQFKSSHSVHELAEALVVLDVALESSYEEGKGQMREQIAAANRRAGAAEARLARMVKRGAVEIPDGELGPR